MKPSLITIPHLQMGAPDTVSIQPVVVAENTLWVVSMRFGTDAEGQRWFGDAGAALAFAAGRAAAFDLPLFELSDEGDAT